MSFGPVIHVPSASESDPPASDTFSESSVLLHPPSGGPQGELLSPS